MPEFRLLFLDSARQVIGYEAFEAATDEDALEYAKVFMDGRIMELTCGARVIARLEPN